MPKLCHVVNEIFADTVLFVSVNNLTLAQGYLYSILYYLLGQVNKLEIFSWPFFVIFKPANNTSTHCVISYNKQSLGQCHFTYTFIGPGISLGPSRNHTIINRKSIVSPYLDIEQGYTCLQRGTVVMMAL